MHAATGNATRNGDSATSAPRHRLIIFPFICGSVARVRPRLALRGRSLGRRSEAGTRGARARALRGGQDLWRLGAFASPRHKHHDLHKLAARNVAINARTLSALPSPPPHLRDWLCYKQIHYAHNTLTIIWSDGPVFVESCNKRTRGPQTCASSLISACACIILQYV